MEDSFDFDDADGEIIIQSESSASTTGLNNPVNVSDVAKFWEEFKSVTRSYAETDEVSLLLRMCSTVQIMDYMFYYLAACCAFSASPNTMSTSELYDHFYLVTESIVRNAPSQERFLNGIFASTPGNTWPDGFLNYVTMMMDEVPSNAWLKANRMRLMAPTQLKKIYFGFRVLKAWEESKR